jgi:hypothetical protein
VPRFWIASMATACLACVGCGLADYESRMEMQQKKVRYAEEQTQNLEPYKLLLPDRKLEDEVPKEEFFMRPPKGILNTTDEKIIGNDIAEFLPCGATPIQKMWVAAVKRDSEPKFQNDVLDLLKFKSKQKKPKTVTGLQELKYDWVHDDQASKGCFDAFFYKKSPYLVAIVIKTEGNRESAITPAQLDYALASVRVGSEAKGQKAPKASAPIKPAKPTK